MPTAESETNPVPDDARFFRQSISPHPIGRSSKARHCSSLPPSSASAESYSAGQMLTPEHPHGLPYRLRYNLPSARTAVGPVRSTSPSLLRVSAPMDALIGVRAGVALCGRTPSTVLPCPSPFRVWPAPRCRCRLHQLCCVLPSPRWMRSRRRAGQRHGCGSLLGVPLPPPGQLPATTPVCERTQRCRVCRSAAAPAIVTAGLRSVGR